MNVVASAPDGRPGPREMRPWRLWAYIRRLEHGLTVAHVELDKLQPKDVTP